MKRMILTLVLLIIGIPAYVVADDYSSAFEFSMMAWESTWHPQNTSIDIDIHVSEPSSYSSSPANHEGIFKLIREQREYKLVKSLQRREEYEYRPYSDNSAERNFKANFYNEWENR